MVNICVNYAGKTKTYAPIIYMQKKGVKIFWEKYFNKYALYNEKEGVKNPKPLTIIICI